MVEPTSGNTGPSLAFVSAPGAIRCCLTMPETMSMERRKMLRVFGRNSSSPRGTQGMPGAIAKAEEIVAGEQSPAEEGLLHVLVGTNHADDLDDYRPGCRSATELRVVSPYSKPGLRKWKSGTAEEIRGLPTWDKPASACLRRAASLTTV